MRTVIEKFLQKQEKKNLVARVQKSQILMSFLTLIVCVGVLCTGSWAYFTDSATVSVEKIQAKPEFGNTGTGTESSLALLTTVKYIQEEPEVIAETGQSDEPEENAADPSGPQLEDPEEGSEELSENVFTALQDGKYQFTMVFSGNTAGYGKISVSDGKETDGTEKTYVTKVVTPTETESVEYSVVIQLATGCTVSFEACPGELPEDVELEIVAREAEILFSNLENTEEQPTEEPSEEKPTEDKEDPDIEPTEGEPLPEAGDPAPETGNPAPEDGEPAPQTEPQTQPQAAEEETEVSEE